MCDGKSLFERDLEGVRFKKSDGTQTGFPLDWRQAALASIQPKGSIGELAVLQEAMAKLLILRPNPRSMERESKAESKRPDLYLTGLTSWYRSLSQDLDWTVALRDLLQEVWPDFKSLKLVDVGLNTKALQLRFDGSSQGLPAACSGQKTADGARRRLTRALSSGSLQVALDDVWSGWRWCKTGRQRWGDPVGTGGLEVGA